MVLATQCVHIERPAHAQDRCKACSKKVYYLEHKLGLCHTVRREIPKDMNVQSETKINEFKHNACGNIDLGSIEMNKQLTQQSISIEDLVIILIGNIFLLLHEQ